MDCPPVKARDFKALEWPRFAAYGLFQQGLNNSESSRRTRPGPTWPNRYFVDGASSSGLVDSPSETEMGKWETVSGFTYPKGSL